MIQSNPLYVIVSSPRMHEMAESVVSIIKDTHGITIPHYKLKFEKFANREHCTRIPETVREQRVFLFHPLQFPNPNEALMDMLIACDALKRASVERITLVVPYMSYLRQDRINKPREPITARLVADMIERNSQVRNIITLDMHAEQAQGFFSIPVNNLSSQGTFLDFVKGRYPGMTEELVVAAPDFGSAKRARKFAEKLGIPGKVVIIEKSRPRANESEILSVIGSVSVKDRVLLIYDDMIDTGGTVAQAAQTLLGPEFGAREVVIMATHGIFSKKSGITKLAASGAVIATTNSIPRKKAVHSSFVTVSIDQYLAKIIYENTLVGGSVSRHA